MQLDAICGDKFALLPSCAWTSPNWKGRGRVDRAAERTSGDDVTGAQDQDWFVAIGLPDAYQSCLLWLSGDPRHLRGREGGQGRPERVPQASQGPWVEGHPANHLGCLRDRAFTPPVALDNRGTAKIIIDHLDLGPPRNGPAWSKNLACVKQTKAGEVRRLEGLRPKLWDLQALVVARAHISTRLAALVTLRIA